MRPLALLLLAALPACWAADRVVVKTVVRTLGRQPGAPPPPGPGASSGALWRLTRAGVCGQSPNNGACTEPAQAGDKLTVQYTVRASCAGRPPELDSALIDDQFSRLACACGRCQYHAPSSACHLLRAQYQVQCQGCKCEELTLSIVLQGKLTDGTTFDTSVGKSPFAFTLGAGQVIKGWDEGMTGMW